MTVRPPPRPLGRESGSEAPEDRQARNGNLLWVDVYRPQHHLHLSTSPFTHLAGACYEKERFVACDRARQPTEPTLQGTHRHHDGGIRGVKGTDTQQGPCGCTPPRASAELKIVAVHDEAAATRSEHKVLRPSTGCGRTDRLRED